MTSESYRAARPRQMIDDRFRRAYSPSIPTPVRERTRLGVGEPYAPRGDAPITSLPSR